MMVNAAGFLPPGSQLIEVQLGGKGQYSCEQRDQAQPVFSQW